MSTLAAVSAINDALAVAAAITRAMQIAELAGREVTAEEVKAAKDSLMASIDELEQVIEDVKNDAGVV